MAAGEVLSKEAAARAKLKRGHTRQTGKLKESQRDEEVNAVVIVSVSQPLSRVCSVNVCQVVLLYLP